MKHLGITLSLSLTLSIAFALAPRQASADDEVEEVLKRFEHEPKIRQVQVAAINYYNVSPSKIASLRTRTRTKALIPGISIGVTNSLSSFNRAVDDIIFRNVGIAKLEEQTADFFGFSASASWALDRLVFNAEELDVMSLIGIQDGLQREVTALYYVRRRLQIEILLNPPRELASRLSGRLRLEELTGLLDAYTGGYFSKEITRNLKRKKKKSAYVPPRVRKVPSKTIAGPGKVDELRMRNTGSSAATK
ncbi:MAG: hypothetical protein JKY56_25065 [Kofleriaceae bacterium]|nr:hypothetical protein [Kofleriaceae bacterium]